MLLRGAPGSAYDAIGQEVERGGRCLEDRGMTHADLDHPIDLEHVRRGRRVLELLVLRFGVAHFLDAQPARGRPRRAPAQVCTRACDEAVTLARSWIERRTGREVSDGVLRLMRKDLRALLSRRIREGAACVR